MLLDASYEVQTVRDCGFEGKNGDLLKLAEKAFDGFVTMDKGIPFQQATTKVMILLLSYRLIQTATQNLHP